MQTPEDDENNAETTPESSNEAGREIDPEEFQALVNLMQAYDTTVDRCSDYLIYISLVGELERTGREISEIDFNSEEFQQTRNRLKKDRKEWKALRNSGRELFRKIKKLNATPIPDIIAALESRDIELKTAIRARLMLRRLEDSLISLGNLEANGAHEKQNDHDRK